MRIVTDDKKIKRQALIGRIALFGSLGILIGGLLLTVFGQQFGLLEAGNIGLFYLIYTIVLVVGFGISRIGMYYGNRYLAANRPEMVLREHLKGLDRKFSLLIFKLPVDYVLVEPGGVTVLIVKNQGGKVEFKNGKWRSRSGILGFWLGRDEPLGSPSEDATAAMTKINNIFTEKIPELRIPLRAVIVFSNPKVQLETETLPYTVLAPDGLKEYVRGENKLKELPNSIQRKIRAALDVPELPQAEKQG